MAFEVSYIISAIDKFSGVAEKIATSTKKMDASVAASGRKLATMQERTAASAKSWKNVANEAKYFSLAAVGAIGMSIREWGKQEDAISKVGVVLANTHGRLGMTMDDLTANATALAGKSLFADEDILENLSGKLMLFKGVSKESFGRAQQDIIDYATYMKVDLATATSVVGKALQSPTKGIRGLRSAGVMLSATQLETIKNLEATGQKAKAQEIVFAALEGRFKGVGEAATKTSSGQITMMNKSIGELSESIGKSLVPVIIPLVRWLAALADKLANASPLVKGLVAGFLLFVAVVAPLAMIISATATVLGVLSAATAFLTGMNFMLAASFIVAYAPIIAIAAIIATACFVIYRFYTYWDLVVETLKKAWEWITKISSAVMGGTMEVMKTISHIFSGSAEVGGKIDININDKGNNVKSATSKSNSGVALAVGQNMPAGAF